MKILPTIIIEDHFIYSYRVSSCNNFNIKPINILPTLFSLNAVLVIIKRLSPTAKIILQPFNFLRFNEAFQMTIVIILSIVISFLMLKILSKNFKLLKTKRVLQLE